MYGWRGKIGFISPIVAETSIRAFNEMLPDGVTMAVTCLSIQDFKKEEFAHSKSQIDRAAEDLARAEVDCIIVVGSPMIYGLDGFGSDKVIIERIEKKWKLPTTTSQTCQVDALKAMGISKAGMCTVFSADLTSKKRDFVERSGIKILAANSLNCSNNIEVANLPPHIAYQIAKKTYLEAPEIDGLLMHCSQWRNHECIQKIEDDFGVTVVAGNQSYVWWGLKTLKIKDRITGYGRLLASLSA